MRWAVAAVRVIDHVMGKTELAMINRVAYHSFLFHFSKSCKRLIIIRCKVSYRL